MRLEQLEYVTAVTQHGSLRRASEHLHVSQPAISEAITKLERELGVTLLDRKRSGARISREGQELLRGMEEVLDAVDRLRSMAGGRTRPERSIRVGAQNADTARLLLPVVRRHRRAVPGATVEIRAVPQAEIHTLLGEGSLDLGLVDLLGGEVVPPDLSHVPLLRGRPVAVMPADHVLAAKQSVDADDLRRHPFVGLRAGHPMHRVAHQLFGTDPPTDWHTTDSAEMAKLMVAEGLGLCVLPELGVAGDPLERAGTLTTRPLVHDTTTVTTVLLHRHRSPAADTVRALVGTFREVAAEICAADGQAPVRRTTVAAG